MHWTKNCNHKTSLCQVVTDKIILPFWNTRNIFFTFDEMLCILEKQKKTYMFVVNKFLKKVVRITCYAAYATFDTFSFQTKFSKYFQIEIGGRI